MLGNSFMGIVAIIISIICGIVCAFLHKKKGYSPIAGFCWGFFFSFIGLLIVILETSKQEKENSGQKGLKVWQWILIFVGIGTILTIIAVFVIMPNLSGKNRNNEANTNQSMVGETTKEDFSNRTLEINYSTDTVVNDNFDNIEKLYFNLNKNKWNQTSTQATVKTYSYPTENMSLTIACNDIGENEEDIVAYMNNRYQNDSKKKRVEAKKGVINNTPWYMFNYYDGTLNDVFYLTDYENKRYRVNISFFNDNFLNAMKNIEEVVNTLVFK